MKRFIERAINLLFIALSGMKTGINGDILGNCEAIYNVSPLISLLLSPQHSALCFPQQDRAMITLYNKYKEQGLTSDEVRQAALSALTDTFATINKPPSTLA